MKQKGKERIALAGTSANGEETTGRYANGRQSQTAGQCCKWSLNHGIKTHSSAPPCFNPVMFFPPQDHSGGQKRQMSGISVDIAGAKLQIVRFPWRQASVWERKKHIMSCLKRLSVFWFRCKMYCHYCLFHSCLVVVENMQSKCRTRLLEWFTSHFCSQF